MRGAGTNVLRIEGVEALEPTSYMVVPDRIEAGTLMIAAAATMGALTIENAVPEHMKSITAKLREAGVYVVEDVDGSITVQADSRPDGVDVKTMHIRFPDLQAQFMALMCVSSGMSVIAETVFENKFMHVAELARMGASIGR